MSGISVLTLVKNRAGHLAQLLEGLRRGDVPPDEVVVVDMDDVPALLPEQAFPIRRLHLPTAGLPLAQARNLAAAAAAHEKLLFLDVDCIPMRRLVGAMAGHLAGRDALICAEIRYLAAGDARGTWDEDGLRGAAMAHPVREFPPSGLAACDNPGLFWSLAFGISRACFAGLGGFEEMFTGYGAEDTDFAFRAHREGLPLALLGGAAAGVGAFHQHHPVFDPPLQHFEDILRNARLFRARWNFWPMQGWLEDFAGMGLIARTGNALKILRRPNASEFAAARKIDRLF